MRTLILAVLSGFWLAGGVLAASAHPATEQFIPIGASPGPGAVKGHADSIAQSAAAGGETVISITPDEAGAAAQPFVIGPNTRIYIDRSAEHLPNMLGTVEDLQTGAVVEARVANPETRVAEWVKVRK